MSAEKFSGRQPAVAVFKEGQPPKYAHNGKELDGLTKAESDGGQAYTEQYIRQEWPKLMSHPQVGMPDIRVANEIEQEAAKKIGYNYDSYANLQGKLARSDAGAAAPSFDPKAQAKIDAQEKETAAMKAELAELKEMVKQLANVPPAMPQPEQPNEAKRK